MLVFITILAGIVMFALAKMYSDEDRRIPPANTKRGKEARVTVGIAMVIFAYLFILSLKESGSDGHISSLLIIPMILGGSIPIVRYVQYKRRKK